jgi:hypothetical protein
LIYLFTLTIFISSALLFLVEPMIARLLLPMLGGTPAVWNTCGGSARGCRQLCTPRCGSSRSP